MARVPAKVQFKRYQRVREIWVAQHVAFSYLDPRSQSAIHSFYQPDCDHLPDSLSTHQWVAAKTDPALPHRAGKPYKELTHVAAALVRAQTAPQTAAQRGHAKGPKRQRNVTVRAVVRPEPDLDKIARALIELAQRLAEKERR